MSLREATRVIIDSEDPTEWLRLADRYMETFNKMPESFVLPAKHGILRWVIEAFHDNLDAFVQYTRAIRDQFPQGEKRVNIQVFYRTILTRAVQKSRRARMVAAIGAVEAGLGRPLEPDERDRVTKKLEQYWANRRTEFLKAYRSDTVKGRLRTDERAELLTEFWNEIDQEIARRELPMFKI